jgi:hypothetical protein
MRGCCRREIGQERWDDWSDEGSMVNPYQKYPKRAIARRFFQRHPVNTTKEY